MASGVTTRGQRPVTPSFHTTGDPAPPTPAWGGGATTGPAKSGRRGRPGATADVTVVQAGVVLAQVATEALVQAALVIAVLSEEVIVSVTEPRVKTAARDWVMRLSAPNAKPWSAPKCRCASWPHKHMARPWAA